MYTRSTDIELKSDRALSRLKSHAAINYLDQDLSQGAHPLSRRGDNYGSCRLAFLGLSVHVADHLPSLFEASSPALNVLLNWVLGTVSSVTFFTPLLLHVTSSQSSCIFCRMT